MLLGDGRDDQSRVKRYKCRTQRGKLRVPPLDLQITSADRVRDVVSAALMVLASMRDVDVELGVFP